MKTKYFIVFFALSCITAFIACSKHAGDVEEQVPTAILTFASPTEGAMYKSGDSVLIQCLGAASATMHGCEITIRNAADTSIVYYNEHIHDHSDTFSINQKWKDTLTTAANLQVEVTLILDHDGHTSTKAVAFKSMNE